jgi:hypothetical protein
MLPYGCLMLPCGSLKDPYGSLELPYGSYFNPHLTRLHYRVQFAPLPQDEVRGGVEVAPRLQDTERVR